MFLSWLDRWASLGKAAVAKLALDAARKYSVRVDRGEPQLWLLAVAVS